MPDSTKTEAAVVAELAERAVEPSFLTDDLYALVVPEGANVVELDLEPRAANPRRARGHVTLDDAASLAAYIGRHGEPDGRTSLYADLDENKIVAILNGHAEPKRPGWGDHRATLILRKSVEWRRWIAHDGKLVDQVTFAELVEEGIDDVVAPPAAELLELALTFSAKTSVNFKQGANLSDGSRTLIYEEQVDARGGAKGELTIPKTFTLRLRPFDGDESVDVVARLRYRLRDGRLAIGYSLDRAEEHLRDAFARTVRGLEATTGVVAYLGRLK